MRRVRVKLLQFVWVEVLTLTLLIANQSFAETTATQPRQSGTETRTERTQRFNPPRPRRVGDPPAPQPPDPDLNTPDGPAVSRFRTEKEKEIRDRYGEEIRKAIVPLFSELTDWPEDMVDFEFDPSPESYAAEITVTQTRIAHGHTDIRPKVRIGRGFMDKILPKPITDDLLGDTVFITTCSERSPTEHPRVSLKAHAPHRLHEIPLISPTTKNR
jgi:hypothetical protein